MSLTMQPVGEIARVGQVTVFGLALHQFYPSAKSDPVVDTVYLNLAGPPTSVEAVWAALVDHQTTLFKATGGSVKYLSHSAISQDNPAFDRHLRRIPGLGIDHLILLDRRFREVNYDGDTATAFLFDGSHLPAQLTQHVRQMVNLAVFDEWSACLPALARAQRLLTPLECLGHSVYQLELDRARWELTISLALERGQLPWPGATPGALAPLDTTPRLQPGDSFEHASRRYRLTRITPDVCALDLDANPPISRVWGSPAIFEQATGYRLAATPPLPPEPNAAPLSPAAPVATSGDSVLATDISYVYTRAQAIEDGVLVDATIGDLAEVTRQHYPCHVAMTASVWNIIERAVKNKKQLNDAKGVWHDILWMSQKVAFRVSPGVRRFKVKITGAGRQSLYTFKLVEGSGDDREPVITIMLPEED